MSLTMPFVPTSLQPISFSNDLKMHFSSPRYFYLMALTFTNSLYHCVGLSCLFIIEMDISLRPSRFSHSAPSISPFFSIFRILIFLNPILGHIMPLAIFGGYVHWFLLFNFLRFIYGSRVLTRRSVYIFITVLLAPFLHFSHYITAAS